VVDVIAREELALATAKVAAQGAAIAAGKVFYFFYSQAYS